MDDIRVGSLCHPYFIIHICPDIHKQKKPKQVSCTWSVNDIIWECIAASVQSDLIIIFTDEAVSETASVLVYLKDHCAEKNKQIIVIGAKSEYDILEGFIPPEYIFRFFNRPLDMDLLLNDIENYMDEESRHSRRKSILIVDDDVSYMAMISDWLKDIYRVSKAHSGLQAITWLAKNHADLILLDYEMPVTSGPQVLEMLRSDASTSHIPVIFLTGKGDKESIMKVLALKPEGYLLKTIKKNELRENIAHYFASKII